jgi:DNA-binding beta-propeller fold protein YncE
MVQVGQGTLSPSGTATAVVPVTNDPVNTLIYFEARATLGALKGLSGSISTRVVAQAPSGPRRPEAVAATPDGKKAYVVNQADGTLQTLNPVKDKLVDEIPIAVPVTSVGLPMAAAVDPEGRHVFVINPQLRTMTVLHTGTDSVAAQVPVDPWCRDIAFAFNGTDRKIFVTNELDQAVLVFNEGPNPGQFVQVDTLKLQGQGPGPIVVLPSGLLMIGQRVTHELEVVDPSVPGGATVARTPLRGVPWDIVISGGRLVVPTFSPAQSQARGDGDNVVTTVDMANFQIITPNAFLNQGTDFVAAAAADPLLAVMATGSGVVLVIDTTTLALLERIDLVPGGPTSDPYDVTFVGGSGKLWVLNHLRETVRTINTAVGPPFVLRPEIPLARSGAPRVPLVDLSPVENGEWFFNTVEYFNGNANNPNRVTCSTCHPHTFSTGLLHPNFGVNPKSSQTLFDMGVTGPWGWQGNILDLMAFEDTLFMVHGKLGGTLRPEAKQGLFDFMTMGTKVPVSPFLNADGSMSEAAARGKTVFEGKAQCSTCHPAPLYTNLQTFQNGVGVNLAPDNVASLRGIWSSAPYLWNASAPTLRDVIVNNPGDQHGTTSGLTPQEIDDLIEFLKTL